MVYLIFLKTSKKKYIIFLRFVLSCYIDFLWNHVNWSAELRKWWGWTPHSVTLWELFFLQHILPFLTVFRHSSEGGGCMQEGQTNYGNFRNFFQLAWSLCGLTSYFCWQLVWYMMFSVIICAQTWPGFIALLRLHLINTNHTSIKRSRR